MQWFPPLLTVFWVDTLLKIIISNKYIVILMKAWGINTNVLFIYEQVNINHLPFTSQCRKMVRHTWKTWEFKAFNIPFSTSDASQMAAKIDLMHNIFQKYSWQVRHTNHTGYYLQSVSCSRIVLVTGWRDPVTTEAAAQRCSVIFSEAS